MRRKLLFVSPRFIFPTDSGGKIRTAQILRGLSDGAFEVTLVSPQPPGGPDGFRGELDTVCHRFIGWEGPRRGPLSGLSRMVHLCSRLPIPVATDRSARGRAVVAEQLDRRPDVVVFDFPHSAVLAPPVFETPSVLFTHNVESWIFRRHAEVAGNAVIRGIWRNQWRKMERFEQTTLARFHSIVAVSDVDADWFRDNCGIGNVQVIPTGVDLDFFEYSAPQAEDSVVFTGSMDWMANQDGIEYFMRDIWPMIERARPGATMSVIGRKPPKSLVSQASGMPWAFTGFVDDVRPHVRGGSAYVIPLRVGGGTRIKAFEAMAMGCPVISTTIGVEGLPVVDGEHYLRADTPADFAEAVVTVLGDAELRTRLSENARRFVEQNFSAQRAAEAFSAICTETLERAHA
jgi:glycosyltransferase involved in cell wall biosynthesis